ncbi:MAG: hypothetical protein EXS38_12100 [Opitutus sp.]|nr:hypothetical protein [Opitutus sp.]
MTGGLPSKIVADICFIGRTGGFVKKLGGFKKGRHTLPDSVNATTTAFLGKLCAGELTDEAETLFQEARTNLGYKRRDVSLSTVSPTATLTAKDFTVEIAYALEAGAPDRYTVVTILRVLKSQELARTAEFGRIFAARFSEISFALHEGARVEAVIDAIEALDGEGGLTVSYPSDCRECVIAVEGVDAQVRCSGATLEVVFPRAGAPAELIDGFNAVREAFQISKALAGLIG